jgi:hypothetical protein
MRPHPGVQKSSVLDILDIHDFRLFSKIKLFSLLVLRKLNRGDRCHFTSSRICDVSLSLPWWS